MVHMKSNRIQFLWERTSGVQRFRAAVSLHSHTLHSQESLDFIPRIAAKVPGLPRVIEMARGSNPVDWKRAWWTPPLTPQEAFSVEAAQVASLGLFPIVSLTDHDTISAPQQLRILPAHSRMPISVEWTVPWQSTFFHVGVHGLPPAQADELWRGMNRAPESEIPGWLERLHAMPEVLIVFNHPLWDEKGIGVKEHEKAVLSLLGRCRQWIHAVELNGMRSWRENRAAVRLAVNHSLPTISGGDRHGCEPNVCLNLTNAASFAEFVQEVRAGFSEVLFLPEYRNHTTFRVMHQMWEILRDNDSHGLGWRNWSDRIFYRCASGEVKSLRQLWGGQIPPILTCFIRLVKLMSHSPVRNALRAALRPQEMEAL